MSKYISTYLFRILHCTVALTGSNAGRVFTLHDKNCQKVGLHVEREKNSRLKVSCNQISNLSQLFAQENPTNVLIHFQSSTNFSLFLPCKGLDICCISGQLVHFKPN